MHRPRFMTAWFLPRSFDVLSMLITQLELVERGTVVLVQWAHGAVAIHDAAAELRAVAEAGHLARRSFHNAVRDSFSTPIEAEDLFELGERLGEITDAEYALIREAELSSTDPARLTADPRLAGLLDALAAATIPLAEGLRALPAGSAAAHADHAIDALSAAEHAYRAAIADLENEPDARWEMRRRELYRRAEHVRDAILRVARRTGYSVYKSR